jgi:plasmid maintenance system antidote protein VapI
MATRSDVKQAVAAAKEARQQVPAVLRRLMRYFDLTDGDVAAAFDVSRQTVNAWANARTRIPEEIETGLAAYFGMPKEVLYSSPDDAIRWVLDHPSDLRIRQKRCIAA